MEGRVFDGDGAGGGVAWFYEFALVFTGIGIFDDFDAKDVDGAFVDFFKAVAFNWGTVFYIVIYKLVLIKILENPRKSKKIQENPRKSKKIQENPDKFQEILGNFRKF